MGSAKAREKDRVRILNGIGTHVAMCPYLCPVSSLSFSM
jgi:hypothetical protein